MNREEDWENFQKTGSVNDYLKFTNGFNDDPDTQKVGSFDCTSASATNQTGSYESGSDSYSGTNQADSYNSVNSSESNSFQNQLNPGSAGCGGKADSNEYDTYDESDVSNGGSYSGENSYQE